MPIVVRRGLRSTRGTNSALRLHVEAWDLSRNHLNFKQADARKTKLQFQSSPSVEAQKWNLKDDVLGLLCLSIYHPAQKMNKWLSPSIFNYSFLQRIASIAMAGFFGVPALSS